MAKGCALSTGYLPRGGLPRNSVDKITDRPDMTSAVDRGRKASTQTNKNKSKTGLKAVVLLWFSMFVINVCVYTVFAFVRADSINFST